MYFINVGNYSFLRKFKEVEQSLVNAFTQNQGHKEVSKEMIIENNKEKETQTAHI